MTRYLQHTKTGDLYIWNEYLAARPDMLEYAESEERTGESLSPEPQTEPEPATLDPYATIPTADLEKSSVDYREPEPDLDAMTRHELIDFAQDRFGVSLNHKDKKEALMSQVAVLLHRGK